MEFVGPADCCSLSLVPPWRRCLGRTWRVRHVFFSNNLACILPELLSVPAELGEVTSESWRMLVAQQGDAITNFLKPRGALARHWSCQIGPAALIFTTPADDVCPPWFLDGIDIYAGFGIADDEQASALMPPLLYSAQGVLGRCTAAGDLVTTMRHAQRGLILRHSSSRPPPVPAGSWSLSARKFLLIPM